MRTRSLLVFLFLGLILFLSSLNSALACDPDTGDTLDCSFVPMGSPTSTAESASNASNLSGDKQVAASVNGSFTASNGNAASLPLSCLLPDDTGLSNALGIPDICPAAPVRVSTIKVAPTPVPAPKVAIAAVPPSPKGDSPASAKTISDVLQTLEPGGVHWYKIDNGKNFYLDVWLDANGQSGITFAMYSPEQTNGLAVDTIPKGRGGPAKNQPHDLLWKGSFATGVWYALVRNYNPTPIQYKLGIQQSTTDRNCVGFWEFVDGGPIWWVDCGHYGIGGK